MDNTSAVQDKINYEHIFQALPGQVILLSLELTALAVSNAYLQVAHSSRAAIIGKNLAEIFPDHAAPGVSVPEEQLEYSVRLAIRTKKIQRLPVLRYNIAPQSTQEEALEQRFWELTSQPVLNGAEEVVCVVLEVRDVTEQHLAEQEVKSAQENLGRMSRAAGGIVWEYDVPRKKLTWSESYRDIFGYTDQHLEVEPSQWDDHVHPNDLQQIRESMDAVIRSKKKTWTGEYRYLKADGSYADVIDHGYILYDSLEMPMRMFGSMVDVTRQKAHEQELLESQRRFEIVAKVTNDVIWDWNLQTSSIWWSEGFRVLFGYKEEEVGDTVSSWTSRVHEKDSERVKASIYEVINGGKSSWKNEYQFRCADGSYKIVQDSGQVLHNAYAEPVRMIGAMRDITAKRKYEQQLENSLAWTREILESLPHLAWTAYADGAVNYYNQNWYDYTGTSFAELKEWGWLRVIHPDDAEETERLWLQAVMAGESFMAENRWLSAETGTYRWFLARAVPLRDENGQVSMWVGTHTDIEDHKQIQLALQESKEKFKFLAESIPQMVWTTDSRGYHDYFNQRWIDYTGLSLEQSLGLAWRDMLHPDDRERTSERWQQSLQAGDFYEIEYRFRNALDGNYRWFLAQAMPMRNEEGSIVKWFGTCTDIEDHKRAEEELLEKNLELERMNQDLDSFVYTASHDLKLPIVNMAGIFEELLQSAEFKDPEAPKMVAMFNKSLEQIHSTIQDLSEVVKVQKANVREQEDVNLQEITESVKISIQDTLRQAGAKIITDFEKAPELAFSRSSMKSILYNLISNAIKYRSHTRPPEVRLSTQVKGEFIELKVQDNGLGIDMNRHQNKLFQMFKRFHNHVNGSGLGLYIVNRLLTKDGGYINIESTLDEGTTFYLYFKHKKV